MNKKKYYGKYRGAVINNVDPEMRGRLMIMVPDVLALVSSTWAEACAPLTGPAGVPMGFYIVPPVGAGVWVEFENGNLDFPIWVGCRWGSTSGVPPISFGGLPESPNIVLQSSGQNTFFISDLPGPAGGIVLKNSAGASIIINDTGIFIQNGKGAEISLVGPLVNINNGALTVP
jgi:hypothetical protein